MLEEVIKALLRLHELVLQKKVILRILIEVLHVIEILHSEVHKVHLIDLIIHHCYLLLVLTVFERVFEDPVLRMKNKHFTFNLIR